MKKTILLLSVFLFALSLFAQEATVKFYLNDGSQPKVYTISEINNIGLIKSEISSIMTVYNKIDSLTRYYDLSNINQILFENKQIKFVLTDTTIFQNLSEIDSITIKQKEQKFISVSINNQIPNLKLLRISSYADYNRQFDSLGIAKVLITRNGLPQIIMVSDTANNLIAMGIAKSTDSTIYINGFSSISALVYQNAYMMGMTLEQGADSVVDFIHNLGEVHYVSSFIDDTINAGRPFMSALDSNSKAILREAYLKTYEYATGDTTLGIAQKDKKDNSDKMLNQDIPIYPGYNSGITITANQDDKGIIHLTITNSKKRYVNVKICDIGSKNFYRIGPSQQLTGSIISAVWDRVVNNNIFTYDGKIDGTCQIQTCGFAIFTSSRYGNHDVFNNDFYMDALYDDFISLSGPPIQLLLSAYLPIIPNKTLIKVCQVLLEVSKNISTDISVSDKLKNNDTWGALQSLIRLTLSSRSTWETIYQKLDEEGFNNLPDINNILSSFSFIFAVWDYANFVRDVTGIDEDSYFFLTPPNKDVEKPKVEILSPTDGNIKANSVIPINIKITDNENVKKLSYWFDNYSSFPIEVKDFGDKAGKEATYTFQWNNTGLIGFHQITIGGEDASGNKSSNNLNFYITQNPEDITKPTVEILSPTGTEIDNGSSVPMVIKVKDENVISHYSLSFENVATGQIDNQKFDKSFTQNLQSEISKTFYINTSKYPVGTVLRFYLLAIDGNYNMSVPYQKDFTIKKSQIPTQGLVAYYPFNGNANDESGHGNNGIDMGNLKYVDDPIGNIKSAAYFDGINDWIKIPNSNDFNFDINDSYSFSLWLKIPKVINDNVGIIEKWAPFIDNGPYPFSIRIGHNGRIYFAIYQINGSGYAVDSIWTFNPVDNNNWFHLICRKTGTKNIQIFINDKLVATRSNLIVKNISNNKDIYIGNYETLFQGYMDDIRIYNRALTDSEILSLYNENSQSNAETVTIGTQVWMKKNLDVDHYRNGDPIPQITDPTEWASLTTGAWCYYNNDPANGSIYGKLYNWYAVNDPRGLAPAGWHVPSHSDWATLIMLLGGDYVAGGKLKEVGSSHWLPPNTGATNESGFNAIPGGIRYYDGRYQYISGYGAWWSSTQFSIAGAWGGSLVYDALTFVWGSGWNQEGWSVRCVKDNNEPCEILGVKYGIETTTLALDNKGLITLPDCIGNFINLKSISIQNNQISVLPSTIGSLTKLETLDAWNNQLSSLPESIGNLRSLKIVSLSQNKLSSLPESIKNLKDNLTILDLENNNFSDSEKIKIQGWLPNTTIYW